MYERDKLWILLGMGVLAAAQILHSRAIAKLQQDVRFGLIVARPVTTVEAPND